MAEFFEKERSELSAVFLAIYYKETWQIKHQSKYNLFLYRPCKNLYATHKLVQRRHTPKTRNIASVSIYTCKNTDVTLRQYHLKG